MRYTSFPIVFAAALVMGGAIAIPQPMGSQSLKNLTGVYLLVEETEKVFEENGLSRNEIESDVRKKLQKASIKVLSKEEMEKTPGMPWLYISVGSGKIDRDVYMYTISMELVQSVMLIRDTRIFCNASTWKSTDKIGAVNRDGIKTLRYNVMDAADEFIYDYQEVNSED